MRSWSGWRPALPTSPGCESWSKPPGCATSPPPSPRYECDHPSVLSWQELLGISVDTPGPGRARVEVEADASTLNPNGVVHGAVYFAIADTAMAAATTSIIDEELACASIDVHMRFLHPVSKGRLTAEAIVLRAGQRVVHLEARISNDEGEHVAMATGSFGVCPKRASLHPHDHVDE